MPKYKRGSGSIYRKRGWWYAAYYVNGRQVVEAAKTKDRKEARDFLNAQLGKLAEGRYIGPKANRVTFEDLAKLVVDDYKANKKKTLKAAERRIKKHLKPFFGGKRAVDITSADVKAFVAHRQSQLRQRGKRKEAPLVAPSNAEINRELSILRRGFNLALEDSLIAQKPNIEKLEEDNVRQGFFDRSEFERVLAALPDYLRPPLTFAYGTGWRILAEVLPLTWNRVELEEGAVRLDPGTTKNKDGRLVYLPAELHAVLSAQWADHEANHPTCEFVFHHDGKRIFSFYKAWCRACGTAGVGRRLPHDFRRSAVRNMVRAGIQERVVMTMAGHRTRAMFDRYNIVSDTDLREAAKRLDAAMKPRTTTQTTTQGSGHDEERPVTH